LKGNDFAQVRPARQIQLNLQCLNCLTAQPPYPGASGDTSTVHYADITLALIFFRVIHQLKMQFRLYEPPAWNYKPGRTDANMARCGGLMGLLLLFDFGLEWFIIHGFLLSGRIRAAS
jgi:hypothetical protein